MTSAIGIMDGAFFVGRKEIVDWINTTLDLSIIRIEDTASGCIACQLLDVMHPGNVPMHKVNWSANKDFEYVGNYKILQTAFAKLNIDKYVDVDRLISGRYMDNLEFMQWFKRFFEMSVQSKGNYDSVGQRTRGKGGDKFFPKSGASKAAPGPSKTHASAAPGAAPGVAKSSSTIAKAKPNTTTTVATTIQTSHAKAPTKTVASKTSSSSSAVTLPKSSSDTATAKSISLELESLKIAHVEMKAESDGIAKERDFYFEKLREIEVMMQKVEEDGQASALTAAIVKVLYATADGFEVVEDEEEEGLAAAAKPEVEVEHDDTY